MEINTLLALMENNLDSKDKRFMFLKIFFPSVIPCVVLEGSIRNTNFSIYDEIKKRGLTAQLEKHIVDVFKPQS